SIDRFGADWPHRRARRRRPACDRARVLPSRDGRAARAGVPSSQQTGEDPVSSSQQIFMMAGEASAPSPRQCIQRRPGTQRATISSDMSELTTVILAAGEGVRMRSRRPKVLHELCGRKLIDYPVKTAAALGARLVVVIGRDADQVRLAVKAVSDA